MLRVHQLCSARAGKQLAELHTVFFILVYAGKQLAELELCERLNTAASWHTYLGGDAEARSLYERVLRIYEWGVAEDPSAGIV